MASNRDGDLPHANVDKKSSRGIIIIFIGAAIVFVLVFLYLTGMFSQQNSKGANSNAQQTNQPANP